jgi:hypothetical protein
LWNDGSVRARRELRVEADAVVELDLALE